MTLQRFEHQGAAPATGLAANISAVATSFTVISGNGYPTGAIGPFVIVLDPGNASEEKVLCSTRSTNTFTVMTRGYDGTSATTHSAGASNVSHVFAAVEADDDNDHVYNVLRDDHTQYALTNGNRAITGGATFNSTVSIGSNLTVAGSSDLNFGLNVTGGDADFSGNVTANSGAVTGETLDVLGYAGTANAMRFVGSTVSGAPATGTYDLGDFSPDQTGRTWICTVAGSPGTWTPSLLAPTYVREVSSGTNEQTTSTSPSEIDTAMRCTATVGPTGIAEITQSIIVALASAGNFDCSLFVQADSGTWEFVTSFSFLTAMSTNTVPLFGQYVYTTLTPGSHTFKFGWSVSSGGTLQLLAASRAGISTATYMQVKTV